VDATTGGCAGPLLDGGADVAAAEDDSTEDDGACVADDVAAPDAASDVPGADVAEPDAGSLVPPEVADDGVASDDEGARAPLVADDARVRDAAEEEACAPPEDDVFPSPVVVDVHPASRASHRLHLGFTMHGTCAPATPVHKHAAFVDNTRFHRVPCAPWKRSPPASTT
jgi:hypothetical protein